MKQIIKKLFPRKHKDHMRPHYYGYDGGYVAITKCLNCGLTSWSDNQHYADPCYRCGGTVVKDGSGIWTNNNGVKMWVKPEFKNYE